MAETPNTIPSTPSTELIDGRYEVLDTLGRGAFGRTLLARELATNRRVAIKTLHSERADTLKAFELFAREAAVLRDLRHQGIPAIYESFQSTWKGSKTAFLVMEYVDGPTLEQLIAERHSFSTDDVIALVHDLAAILEYLHERVPPILHRDIKPANVILRNVKQPVLVDFGAVRNVFRAPGEGGSTVVGTYGYMPYEQYMGQATPSSDIYALGATLLHLLTGRPPADFLSDAGRLEVPSPLPGGDRLRAILVRMVAPAVADRFSSAADLRRAILGQPAPLPVTRSHPSVALATAGRAQGLVEMFPAAPRSLDGQVRDAFNRRAMTVWQMMNAMVGKHDAKPNPASVGLIAFFSIVSIGVMPLIFWLMTASHRRRLAPFYTGGYPALAEIEGVTIVTSNMGERTARVTYEFEVDGMRYRGADQILPSVADRWRPGDVIAVLYLPEQNYDSIIASTH